MPQRGIAAKDVIEGPPTRRCLILLRQTSFKALEEAIAFKSAASHEAGTHTARFGEIEQRGLALTRKGRMLYDRLLASVRDEGGAGNAGLAYAARLEQAFEAFPDDHPTLRREGLGFYRYVPTEKGRQASSAGLDSVSMETLVEAGYVTADPIVYEDFLPVSAAGIFQSNLGGQEQRSYASNASKDAFVEALGAPVHDEFEVYERTEARSRDTVREVLGRNAHHTAA